MKARPKGPWWKQPGFGGIDPNKGYFKPMEFKDPFSYDFAEQFVTFSFKSQVQQQFRFREFIIGTSTKHSGSEVQFTPQKYPWQEAIKPTPRRKREPSFRFLKDRDIEKLLDKHFNVKDNSSNGTQAE